MPKGTYLPNQPKFSNPSTQADGLLGGGQGDNPPPPPFPGTPPLPYSVNPFSQAVRAAGIKLGNILFGQKSPYPGYGTTPVNQIPTRDTPYPLYANSVAQAQNTPRQPYPLYAKNLALAQSLKVSSEISNSSANSLVGTDLSANQLELTMTTAQQVFPGKSFSQISQAMATNGFQWNPQTQSFVKVGQSSTTTQANEPLQGSAVSGETDAFGRPTWVDPTQLARNEGVTVSNGWTYVGGIPTKTGESQYAVTAPHGRMTAWEKKHGSRYKWVSSVQRDDNGNYVRVYSRQLRNIYTKHGMKTRAERRRNSGGGGNNGVGSAEINQLVTLRANYG